MNNATRAIARSMFRLRVFESDGQAFQDLFVRIMQYKDSNFRAVRAYGNLGDGGNDGYVRETGTFYQVYAPEEIRSKPNQALIKLRHDFHRLRRYWGPFSKLRVYYFVINDKYKGAPPNLEKTLEGLRRRYGLEKCEPFGAAQLEEILFSLPEDVISTIIGHVPAIDTTDFMLLTGLTYFLGAWIEFEKTGRRLAEQEAVIQRPLGGTQIIAGLRRGDLINPQQADFLLRLNRQRTLVVHGDSVDVPRKDAIDSLVAITSALKNKKTKKKKKKKKKK
jgi:hypothetical protein